MEVLKTVDSNVCYGPMVPRSRLAACKRVYQGRECTHEEAENSVPAVGECYFGMQDVDGSLESKVGELFESIESLKKQLEELELFKKNQEWINAFAALGNTPEMLVASKVGRVQEKAQREFRKMVLYVKMQSALQPQSALADAYKQLTNDCKVKLTTVQEFCEHICVEAQKDPGWGTEGVRQLATFIYKKTMEPIGAEGVCMSEWAWYGYMLQERHKGGHPDVLQRFDSEARLVEVDKLYKRLQVEAAPVGFPDPCIDKFRNLVRIAPPSVKSVPNSVLSPVNFYGDEGILPDNFQTTSRSYRRILDPSEADLIVLQVDDTDKLKRLLFESVAYGVKSALVVVREVLFDYVKEFSKRNRLSVIIASPGDAGLKNRLDSVRLDRPSNELLAVLVVSQVSQVSNNSVEVVGRVNAGILTKQLTLTTNERPAIVSDEDVRSHGLRVRKVDVLHQGCKAIPGAVVSVKLEGNTVADIQRGTVITDFRYGVFGFFKEVKAKVTTVDDVLQGSYTLFCRNAEYKVEVQVTARIRKDNKESVPASELGKNQVGMISMTCKEKMYLESTSPKDGRIWNSYGFSRFLLKKEGRVVLAGVVVPSEVKVGGSKR